MSKPLTLFGLAAVLVIGGCAQPTATTITVVHRDGSFDRRVELAPAPPAGYSGTHPPRVTKAKAAHELATTFAFRRSDGKMVRDPHHRVQTPYWVSKRHFEFGEIAVHDVVIKSEKGRQAVANEASVRPLGDGRWVFTERYHWLGKPLTDKDWVNPELHKATQNALGPGFDSAEIDKLAVRLSKDAFALVSQPKILMKLLQDDSNKDKGEKAEAQFVQLIEQRLNAQAASSAEKEASHRLAELVRSGKEPHSNFDPLPRGVDMPSNAFIEVKVRVPGKVLSTDAELDKDGLWTWSVMSTAPILNDVECRLVFRPAG